MILQLGLCYNCLGNHSVRTCKSDKRCFVCKGHHNSLLHEEEPPPSRPNAQDTLAEDPSRNNSASMVPPKKSFMATNANTAKTVVLATTWVKVETLQGHQALVRGLLDQGSEVSFISEPMAQLLRAPRQRACVSLAGLGQSEAGTARSKVTLVISSQLSPDFSLEIEALVLPKLTGSLPSQPVTEVTLMALKGLTLADDKFHRPGGIDIILGADVYGRLLQEGVRIIPQTQLVAQNTVFGWILSGIAPTAARRAVNTSDTITALHATLHTDVRDDLQRFWELEETSAPKPPMKPEDEACEAHFLRTHTRTPSGRYRVRLPTKTTCPAEGEETRNSAIGTLRSMERRFHHAPELAAGYRDFMHVYEELGHMERLNDASSGLSSAWYIPHHAVVTPTLTGQKLRVVFNASRKTSQGHSFNDFLLAGPPLQNELPLVLLAWRRHRWVFTADVVKMFRQIEVHPDDQDLQRIVWRDSPSGPIADFRLTTVTYGTACAPYLAIRTLRQLAKDEGHRFPLGAQRLTEESYVDDLLTGADDLPSALQLKTEVTALLAAGCFELGKWSANHPSLLAGIGAPDDPPSAPREFNLSEPVKTLGLIWLPSEDSFSFRCDTPFKGPSANTKRVVLSEIARVFDPLGWISPVTISAKILMQDLWLLSIDWDTPLPEAVELRWAQYRLALTGLEALRIKRWTGIMPSVLRCELHGFADASTRAYSAAVFLRIIYPEQPTKVVLLMAKTKVAPVKTVSVPRLELCAASLLTRLVLYLKESPIYKDLPVVNWLDSKVALAWIHKHPSAWKTFVANRTSFIQTALPEASWRHVPTADNPADLATRGITPTVLHSSELWWQGPPWLLLGPESWPPTISDHSTAGKEETSPRVVATIQPTVDPVEELLGRFSSLKRMLRVLAYVFRIVDRCKKTTTPPTTTLLSAQEVEDARSRIVRLVQQTSFPLEIRALQENSGLPTRSSLRSLNPFMDKNQILRVGGRLRHSLLSFQEKHPPILPKSSHLSRLYIDHAHTQVMHGGPSLTCSYLQKHMWIPGARNLTRGYIRRCIRCQKDRPVMGNQQMGDLPASRLTPGRPFSITGLDYAGPVAVRCSPGRGQSTYKGYIALFICFATKAIHLELVSSCTSNTFLAAFRRFVGRRGICRELWSDNSTTFHGADAELRSLFDASSHFYNRVSESLANDGTTWKFIPPSAPHFGGLWEAGVKSTKQHLRRVIGDHTLTFEELSTVLVQVEACLNSRPLWPLSNDPEDLGVLTPAHFLVGSDLFTVPEPSHLETPTNRLSRWQLVQRLHQQFWDRWSSEYLHHLQQRHKWREPVANFAVGQLVLVKDERYPPSKWPLGRVSAVHPGKDGLIRSATVRTANATLERPVVKLSPLLTHSDSALGPQAE